MGIAIQVRDLVKTYGAVKVLDDATVAIPDGAKVGVLGRNGAGKSTLCRILLHQEEADAGEIVVADGLRIGYLEQHDSFEPGETPLAFLMRKTERPEWRCAEVAGRMGLDMSALALQIAQLPGGWRTRVKLTAMLLADPEFLILDEPTNFLDLSTTLLLQGFLADFRGGAMIVSHDREFLKRTCDHTLHVERGALTLYPGDVEEFFSWQAEQIDVARRTNETIEARRVHLQAFVDRFRAKASKATQAQSKMKEIGRLRPIEIANPLATVRIRIPAVEPRRGAALGLEDVSIGYPERVVAAGVRMHVERGARVAIVGDNGQGKTTLLRTLAGDLDPVVGSVWRAPNLEISCYAQHVYQSLHADDTVKSHLERSAAKDVLRQAIMDLAGAFLFQGDEVLKPVRVLSGGERARLCLAGMLLAKRPVLLLDEPTNHLDFETVEALGTALRDYQGTVVFISHDRTFVNMVATEIVEVDQGKVRVVPGTYADYVEALERRARTQSSGRKGDSGKPKAPSSPPGKSKPSKSNPPKPKTAPSADAATPTAAGAPAAAGSHAHRPAHHGAPAHRTTHHAAHPTTHRVAHHAPASKPGHAAPSQPAPAHRPTPATQTVPATSAVQAGHVVTVVPPALTHADRRRRQNEVTRLGGVLKKLEAQLAELEVRRTTLHATIEKEGPNYRPELYTQVHELERDIAFAEQEWLATGEKMQELA